MGSSWTRRRPQAERRSGYERRMASRQRWRTFADFALGTLAFAGFLAFTLWLLTSGKP